MGPLALPSRPKEGVLRIFIALINPLLRPGLNQRTLGQMANTITNKPPTATSIELKEVGWQGAA
jgi:hypothetical protein